MISPDGRPILLCGTPKHAANPDRIRDCPGGIASAPCTACGTVILASVDTIRRIVAEYGVEPTPICPDCSMTSPFRELLTQAEFRPGYIEPDVMHGFVAAIHRGENN